MEACYTANKDGERQMVLGSEDKKSNDRRVGSVWQRQLSNGRHREGRETNSKRPTSQRTNQPNRGSTCGSGSGAGAHRLDWLNGRVPPKFKLERAREREEIQEEIKKTGWLSVCVAASLDRSTHRHTDISVDSKKGNFLFFFFSCLPVSCPIFLPKIWRLG